MNKNPKIYYCGDTHGNIDSLKLEHFFADNITTRDDFMIQLGDFGFIWKEIEDEAQKISLEWIASQNITFCIVLGNHENYNEIKKLPIVEKFGGKVRVLELKNGSIYFFERGEIYQIAGQKIFAFGGALSIDKKLRVLNKSYWTAELPTQDEYDYAVANLEKHDFNVDIVISHTCPRSLIGNLGLFDAKINDPVAGFFDHLLKDKKIKFNEWHFGHFHVDKPFYYEDKLFECHYEYINKAIDCSMPLKQSAKTYADLTVYNYKGILGVLKSDIKKLPLYDDWQTSSIGTTALALDDGDTLVYMHDWINFAKYYPKLR